MLTRASDVVILLEQHAQEIDDDELQALFRPGQETPSSMIARELSRILSIVYNKDCPFGRFKKKTFTDEDILVKVVEENESEKRNCPKRPYGLLGILPRPSNGDIQEGFEAFEPVRISKQQIEDLLLSSTQIVSIDKINKKKGGLEFLKTSHYIEQPDQGETISLAKTDSVKELNVEATGRKRGLSPLNAETKRQIAEEKARAKEDRRRKREEIKRLKIAK